MWFVTASKINILGLTAGKGFLLNPRWCPFKIKKYPAPHIRQYLSFELIFDPR
jgi:hypothetical protein